MAPRRKDLPTIAGSWKHPSSSYSLHIAAIKHVGVSVFCVYRKCSAPEKWEQKQVFLFLFSVQYVHFLDFLRLANYKDFLFKCQVLVYN